MTLRLRGRAPCKDPRGFTALALNKQTSVSQSATDSRRAPAGRNVPISRTLA